MTPKERARVLAMEVRAATTIDDAAEAIEQHMAAPGPVEGLDALRLRELTDLAVALSKDDVCGCETDEPPERCPCGGDDCWTCAAAQALDPPPWILAPWMRARSTPSSTGEASDEAVVGEMLATYLGVVKVDRPSTTDLTSHMRAALAVARRHLSSTGEASDEAVGPGKAESWCGGYRGAPGTVRKLAGKHQINVPCPGCFDCWQCVVKLPHQGFCGACAGCHNDPRARRHLAARPGDVVPAVHYSDWAQQPDIRIACDQTYTTPAWGDPNTSTPGVFKAEDGRLYAFDREDATCPRCREARTPPTTEAPSKERP